MMRLGPRRPDADVWRSGPSFLARDRPLARYLGRPVAEFLRIESAGGVMLLVAAVVAMVCANSGWSGTYDALWHTPIGLNLGGFEVSEDLQHWVNDALMAVFVVVGLEIKYEIVAGHLRDRKVAALPIIAALGGRGLGQVRWWWMKAAPRDPGWTLCGDGGGGHLLGVVGVGGDQGQA